MTTKVVIEPAGHPVMVQIMDHYVTPEGLHKDAYEDQLHLPGDPTIVVYCTTSRTINVFDLDETDARVIATRLAVHKPFKGPA